MLKQETRARLEAARHAPRGLRCKGLTLTRSREHDRDPLAAADEYLAVSVAYWKAYATHGRSGDLRRAEAYAHVSRGREEQARNLSVICMDCGRKQDEHTIAGRTCGNGFHWPTVGDPGNAEHMQFIRGPHWRPLPQASATS